jgi:cytochrome c556
LKSEQVARFGYQLAVIAQVEQAAAPREKIGDKDPKDWRRFTDEMRAAGLALAKAAADDKTPAVRQAAERLGASCSNCHKVFRDN